MIKLDGIHRDFIVGDQTVHALDNINVDIDAGEYISVMGPSGSGKSTLLNIIGLLDRANSGQYYFNGSNTTDLDDQHQAAMRNLHIGFVFQAFHLIPRLTAAENIELPLILAGIPPNRRKKKVIQVVEALDLSDRAKHLPEQLSGGQRQRTAIARAIVNDPSVLLADEPTGNLDQKSGDDVIQVLEKLNQQGITLLVVTHDPIIGRRAKRNIQMIDGRIASDQFN